jgi:hypothetical protein
MQNSFREQAQLINVMRAAENGIAESSRFNRVDQATTTELALRIPHRL